MSKTLRFDVDKMRDDMAERGWVARDIARAAGVSDSTVYYFLHAVRQSPRVADKLSRALGRTPRRYLIRQT